MQKSINNRISKVYDLSCKYRDYTAKNLSKLVQIKSLSRRENKLQVELLRQMKEAGFDEVFIDGLGNIIGRIGNGDKVISFDGHVDTVDVGNIANWNLNPFSGKIKDGFVYGRGTVDQKGGVASFVTAGRILKELGLNKDITVFFIGSVMEEDCNGLCWKYIIEEDKILPDVVICTEPTNLNLYRGQRGRMEIEIILRGISSHSSSPEKGKNAIYKASKVCLEIEKLNDQLRTDGFLGKGSVSVTEIISDSPSLCSVPDYAKIHLDRRLTIGETKKTVIAELEPIIHQLDTELIIPYYEEVSFTGQKYGMEKYFPPWIIDENHPSILTGINSFQKLFKRKPIIDKWTFSTNGVTTKGLFDIPTIGFGPGNEILAHAPNEKISISDLVIASAFYATYVYMY